MVKRCGEFNNLHSLSRTLCRSEMNNCCHSDGTSVRDEQNCVVFSYLGIFTHENAPPLADLEIVSF